MTEIHVVVGAQYGSEAKGHVTAQVIRKYQNHYQRVLNIRVAGPNAGHTVVDHDGNRIALRTIPVGGALVNTNTNDLVCYLAPGSEIQADVLEHEIRTLHELGHYPTVYVSGEATVLTQDHIDRENALAMHQRLGSTAKGIGAARADRIMRVAQRVKDNIAIKGLIASYPGLHLVQDDLQFVEDWLANGDPIIVEGTQGYGLGLHAGHYPKCTSSDTRALDFLAMAGINPWIHDLTIWACARVYPIRVAGDSGYMLGETTWEDLGLPAEQTTVTHKTRRVGAWDPDLVRRAVTANGGWPAVQIALTMADQKVPQVEGWDGNLLDYQDIDGYHDLRKVIYQVAQDADTNVGLVTTSDRTAVWL